MDENTLHGQLTVGQAWLNETQHLNNGLDLVPLPRGEETRNVRHAFDAALGAIHYAGPCSRVGRCMRLLIVDHRKWVGGIVLGSTFPNIGVRDEALGLKAYVRDHQLRGLRSPWARENTDYWNRLQRIVNHARTFIFPASQGQGLGIRAHHLLIDQGKRHWERRYGEPVGAFDTLCDAADSGLFRRNGWAWVGRTAGFESNPEKTLVAVSDRKDLTNNVALRQGTRSWEVWVRIVNRSILS